MEYIPVKDLMIPLDEYATVPADATLYDAIVSLEEAQKNVQGKKPLHRAVLVEDTEGRIVGKVGHEAFLQALEPKYGKTPDVEKLASARVSEFYIQSMMDHFHLWEDNLKDICKRSRSTKVKDAMRPVTENIDAEASLDEAIHKFVMWQCLSLLVLKDDQIIGILRLSDLYDQMVTFIQTRCDQQHD
jgi:CBS domain-containing protein